MRDHGYSTDDDLPEDRLDRLEHQLGDAEERADRLSKQLRDDGLAMAQASVPSLVDCAVCGNRFGLKKFRTLTLKGYMSDLAGDRLELRTCGCGNNLSIRVPA